MMITLATFEVLVLVIMMLFCINASTKNSAAVSGTRELTAEKVDSLAEIAKKAIENLYFEWGGGPDGPGGPGGPGPDYGGPGPGYGPYYGGGYGGPYGGGGYFGPYGPWYGGPGAGGYGQYNPYYGPNGYGPTGNSAAGHGARPKVPERPDEYGFFQRLKQFFMHWFT